MQVKEQLDFDNAIAACNKAAELLSAHYGDGQPKESRGRGGAGLGYSGAPSTL